MEQCNLPSETTQDAQTGNFAARPIRAVLFNSKNDNTPKPICYELDELREVLTTHDIRPSKDGKLISFVDYKPGTKRANENIIQVNALCLDLDHDVTLEEIKEYLGPYAAFIYSTHRHTPEEPRFRVIVLLARPITAADYPDIWQRVNALFKGKLDKACKDAARMVYLPSCPQESSEFAYTEVLEGEWLHAYELPPVEATAPIIERPTMAPPVHLNGNGNGTGKQAHDLAALAGEVLKVRNAQDNGKHVRVRDSAIALGGLIHRGVLDAAQIEEALYAAVADRAADKAQARRTIQDGIRMGVARPRDIPETSTPARILKRLRTAQSTPAALFADVPADKIPAPALWSEKGKQEYDARQLVELLYPDSEVADLKSHAAHAERIQKHAGEDVRYCAKLGWLGWNGRHWQTDDRNATNTAARVVPLSKVVRAEGAALLRHAATLATSGRASDSEAMTKAATAHLRHAKQTETKTFIEGSLHLAASGLSVEPEAFDQRPWLLGFQNGTWRNGTWEEGHTREDYLLSLSPVTVDFTVERSEWMAVLERITKNDNDFARTLQDSAGYILSGASHLRFIPWPYGPKGTGKSTYAELLQTVLGHMAATIDPKKLQADAARERLGADLWNKRLAVCAEAGSKNLEAELLKTLSGSDTLTVRFLYHESFNAAPRHVLMMVSNDPPKVDAYDEALKDRVVALPFNHLLREPAPLELTGGKRIEAVRREPDSPLVRGFMAWALEGLQRVYETQEVYRAACVDTATTRFWSDTDPLTPFWETVADDELSAGIQKAELRRQYEAWCEGEGCKPLQARQWTRACESHGLLSEKRTGGARFWCKVVAKVAKQDLFSESPRESLNVPYGEVENSPCFATFATNSESEEMEVLDL